MKITTPMILRAAKAMHLHYGIKARPSEGDLKLSAHMLLAAIANIDPPCQADVDKYIEFHNSSQQ